MKMNDNKLTTVNSTKEMITTMTTTKVQDDVKHNVNDRKYIAYLLALNSEGSVSRRMKCKYYIICLRS